MKHTVLAACAILLAACAPTPPPPSPRPVVNRTDCHLGGDARGLTAGFFALVEDRPECF